MLQYMRSLEGEGVKGEKLLQEVDYPRGIERKEMQRGSKARCL